MKKVLTFLMAAMLCSFTMSAQESNRDAQGKIQYGPYQTNCFFDNIFVGIGGGANFGLDRVAADPAAYVYGFGLNAEGYVGKYVTPNFAVRLGWQGHNTSWAGEDEALWQWPNGDRAVAFNYVHGDAMWNITNQFWGYKEKRAISVVPYLNAGILWGHKDRSLGVGAGVEFPIRVSNRVALVPDFRVIGTQASFINPGEEGIAQLTSAALSVRVTLGKSNFRRVSTDALAAAAAYAALQDAKAASDRAAAAAAADAANKQKALDEANARVKKLEEDLKNAYAADDDYTFQYFDLTPYVVYFNIGEAKLTKTEQQKLDYFVKNVLDTNKQVTITVFGSADTGTGSLKRNNYLAGERANTVKNYLADEYGIDVEVLESKLDYNDDADLCRVAVISHK